MSACCTLSLPDANPWLQFSLATLLSLLLVAAALATGLTFGDAVLEWMEETYGDDARQRAVALQKLIAKGSDLDEPQKLRRVNAFFNRVNYDSDDALWDQKDYWATPYEVLGINSADCEDYAISKYFTLLSMGVEEDRLRITYVKALTLDQAHMVLAYYPSADAEPLILDNLSGEIRPAGERKDLVPVYSFNGTDLWLAVNRRKGKKVGESDRLSRWQSFQVRLMQQMAVGQ